MGGCVDEANNVLAPICQRDIPTTRTSHHTRGDRRLAVERRATSVRFVTCSELATMPQSQALEPNETLYIQNLNESVTVPGTYMHEGSEGK